MLTGLTFVLKLISGVTVEEVKNHVYDITTLAPDQQRLSFSGKQFEDGHNIQDYSIKPNSSVLLMLKLRKK